MKTLSKELRNAIEFLGAVEVAPGRFAFRRDLQWYAQSLKCANRGPSGTEQGLESIAEWIKAPCGDRECACRGGLNGVRCALARGEIVEMPFWWTPDKSTAYRIMNARNEEADLRARYGYVPTGLPLGMHAERITVDYETGKEVPA